MTDNISSNLLIIGMLDGKLKQTSGQQWDRLLFFKKVACPLFFKPSVSNIPINQAAFFL
jgi:hypothetical protein